MMGDTEGKSTLYPDLPLVEAPHIAQAALACKSFDAPMTAPRNLDLSRMSGLHTVRKMRNLDMHVRENAFISANWLMYLTKSSQTVQELVASDTKELQDAAWRTPPPDATLPPRKVSLVFLSRGNTSFGGVELLSAASHLAYEVGFGCLERPSRCARFSFLAGADAESFLRLRRDSLPDASRNVDLISPADGTGEVAVAVSWAVRIASQTVLYTALGRLPIPSVRGDVSDIYDNVVSTISGICANRTIPVPYGITASRNPPNFDSFADNQHRVHDEFQTILLPEPRVVLSKYITDSGGTLQFSDGYVRLCPRAYPLDHYSTHSGCLLHEKGKKTQMDALLRSCREKEISAVYGLHPTQGSYEEQIGVHVLTATAVSMQLGASVSSYAVGCHPGARLHVKDGCIVWKLQREIAPVESWLQRDKYVLPCSLAACHPRSEVLQLPLFELLEKTIILTVEVFGEPNVISPRVRTNPVPRKEGVPSDLFYATAFGLGLHVDAVRVGDVLDRVSAASGRPDGLCKLLLTMVHKVGASSSITEAMGWLADGFSSLEQRVEILENQIHEGLEREARQSPPTQSLRLDQQTLLRVTDTLRLKMAPSFVIMNNPPADNEVVALTLIVRKSLRKTKKDIPSTTLAHIKSARASSDKESLVSRLLSVTSVLSEYTQLRCFTFVFDGSNTKIFLGQSPVGLESLFERECGVCGFLHLCLRTGKLHYYLLSSS